TASSTAAGGALMCTTVVVAVALSLPGFGSGVVDAMAAVLLMTVPSAVARGTASTSVKTAFPVGIDPLVHDTVPVPPTGGEVQLHPPGDESDSNVVPGGSVSVSDAL